jgi:phosphate transport system ATP-binding protein
MQGRPHIRVENLNVWYGDHQALKDITLSIPDRKITAIIGPSGCGKTTLLKSFNRLIDLQDGVRVAGKILVDEEDIYAPGVELTRLRRKMGLLFQRPQVLPMSIFENVAYGLRIHGQKEKARLSATVEHYLKMAGLWNEVKDRLNASAARLSIGQQQRLCLARGLTSALDPVSAERIEQRFLELKKDYTIVLVTHILRQAKRLADYVAFVYLGELVEHGPTAEVLGNPKDPRMQAYVSGTFIGADSAEA